MSCSYKGVEEQTGYAAAWASGAVDFWLNDPGYGTRKSGLSYSDSVILAFNAETLVRTRSTNRDGKGQLYSGI